MTTMTQSTTRVVEAQARLIDEFKAHVNIDAIVKAFAQQDQDLEDAAFEVLLNTVLPAAVGVQLDGLGDIVGAERGGLNDTDFAILIQGQILVNKSSGTIPQMIELATAMGASSGVVLTENFPAKFNMESTTLLLPNGAQIGALLVSGRAAGVGFAFIWHNSATPFKFDTAGQGFDLGELGGIVVA